MKIPGDRVFIVICHDRHCDDGITVHVSRDGADREIEKFKASYDRYGWTERDYGRSQGWVRYVDSHDDGPRARIQEVEIKP